MTHTYVDAHSYDFLCMRLPSCAFVRPCNGTQCTPVSRALVLMRSQRVYTFHVRTCVCVLPCFPVCLLLIAFFICLPIFTCSLSLSASIYICSIENIRNQRRKTKGWAIRARAQAPCPLLPPLEGMYPPNCGGVVYACAFCCVNLHLCSYLTFVDVAPSALPRNTIFLHNEISKHCCLNFSQFLEGSFPKLSDCHMDQDFQFAAAIVNIVLLCYVFMFRFVHSLCHLLCKYSCFFLNKTRWHR